LVVFFLENIVSSEEPAMHHRSGYFSRLMLGFAISLLGLTAEGCKCKDGSIPGDDCLCDDGSKAKECTVPGVNQPDSSTPPPDGQVDKTVEALVKSGVKDTAAYADDAIQVDFYGCARIGDTNDVVCVIYLVGSGYDWLVEACDTALVTAIDDMGKEYRVTSVEIADSALIQQFGHCPPKTLAEGIRTQARGRFDGVHSGATTFARLSWRINATSTQENPDAEELIFRDIPLN
jgi:hypothetical protein